ncbi:MAG: HAD-IIB family hydrolase [Acidobacteriota bacterium]|nr:HAD-IIB family hydrolase [Acidobacteriota bacterium]
MKQLVIFDLDGTLAQSKSSMTPEMAGLLKSLMALTRVSVISGGSWAQFEAQLLTALDPDCHFANLTLLPTCGTQFFDYDGSWHQVYAENLSPAQGAQITSALAKALDESGLAPARTWGEVIEDRGTQITMSVLGQEAPLSAKHDWDPDFAKRTKVVELVKPMLPAFAVNMGGTTSIDVTRPGIDKAYGVAKLREHLGVERAEMLFVGDAIFPGGNDFAVQHAGVDAILVRDPNETARVVQTIIACLGDAKVQMVSPRGAS